MSRIPFIYSLALLAVACSDGGPRTPAREPDLAADLRLPDSGTQVATAPNTVTRTAQKVSTPRKTSRAKRVVEPPMEDSTAAQGYVPSTGRDTALPDTTVSPIEQAPPQPTSDPSRSADSTQPQEPPTSSSSADTALTPVSDSVADRDTIAAAPAAQPQPPVSGARRTLPVGTEIKVSLNDSINSRHDTVGQPLSAHVMEAVTSPAGETMIRAGAPVRLTITKLEPAKSRSAAGQVTFRVDGIEVGGRLQEISADVRPVPHELRGRGVTTQDAAKVGVGAAGGAVLGRVIGGNTKGAVIGGVVGAAGGAVVAHQTATRDVIVGAKTPLIFVLTEQLVTP
jgi:hypothetical protein